MVWDITTFNGWLDFENNNFIHHRRCFHWKWSLTQAYEITLSIETGNQFYVEDKGTAFIY